jgi:hypothetical protein
VYFLLVGWGCKHFAGIMLHSFEVLQGEWVDFLVG